MITDTIELKGIIWEDMINYKKIGTTLMFPICKGFKCSCDLCQNSELAAAPSQTIPINSLMRKYIENPFSESIILQGLEPLDSLTDVYTVAAALSEFDIKDDLVIYTGYNKEEIPYDTITKLCNIPGHLIIKWGRYLPNQEPHLDPVLGIYLASDNQYGEQIK